MDSLENGPRLLSCGEREARATVNLERFGRDRHDIVGDYHQKDFIGHKTCFLDLVKKFFPFWGVSQKILISQIF